MIYRLKLKPLEPYSFGVEQAEDAYFVRSGYTPEQTTLWGMLRYVLLRNEGLLKENFYYTPEERQRMKQCIGAESFQMLASHKQDFGYLKSISPLFLMDNADNYYVKNPFHNKNLDGSTMQGYHPMELETKPIRTQMGELLLPGKGEYNAKKGHAAGYYNLTDGTVVTEIFQPYVVSGTRKQANKLDVGDSTFYKRERIVLDEHFSFALFAEISEEARELPQKLFCHMGRYQTAFAMTAEKVQENDLEKRVRQAFSSGKVWQYALSDLLCEEKQEYHTFCIVEEKKMRNLESVYQQERQRDKLRKSERQFNLIQAGSVFYECCSLNLTNKNGSQIGYNQLVQLGGSEHGISGY